MGLSKSNILTLVFIGFLVLTLFAAMQIQERYKEAKAACDYCWNFSQGCAWTIEVYNLSGTYNYTYDNLSALGEGKG